MKWKPPYLYNTKTDNTELTEIRRSSLIIDLGPVFLIDLVIILNLPRARSIQLPRHAFLLTKLALLWSHFKYYPSSRSSSEWPSFYVPKGLDPGSCTAATYRPAGSGHAADGLFINVSCVEVETRYPSFQRCRLPIAQFPHGDANPKITSEASTRALATWVAR